MNEQSFLDKWGVSIGLCLTLFMVGFHVNVVPAIMPKMVRELNTTVGYIQGALVMLSLVMASFTPTSENLSSLYGRKKLFFAGLILYGVGIIVTFLSPNIAMLTVGYSLLTGLAATPLVSTPWALMAGIYEEKQKEYALAVLSIASVAGGLVGSLVGGLIASVSSWRWAFTPEIGMLTLIFLLLRKVSETPRVQDVSLDWISSFLSVFGLGSILLGVSLAGEYGWLKPRKVLKIAGVAIPPFAISIAPILIAVGVIFLGLLVFWERRQAIRGKTSPLRIGLLRRRLFVVGLLTASLHTLFTSGMQFNLFQFLPIVPQLDSLQTALAIIPYTLASLVVMLLTLDLSQRIAAKYLIQGGLVLLSVGIWKLYGVISLSVTAEKLLPGLIIMGIGSGLVLGQIATLTFSAAKPEENAEASGIYNPCQDLGSSLGRGILGTLLIFQGSSSIVHTVLERVGLALSEPEKQEVIFELQEFVQTYNTQEMEDLFSHLPADVQQSLDNIVSTAAVDAMQISLLAILATSFLCILVSLFLPKRSLSR